jgi:hypothetical protein
MPLDPKGKREEKGRNADTVTKDSIRNLHACKKKIDMMSQILQQNNLGYRNLEGAKKKKPEDLNSKKDNSSHALIAINSSLDAWIVDSRASHHMDASKEVYSSLDACKGPPILMGDNSSVEVTGKGRIELTNEIFENVLHVPKLSVNLLFMYQMTNFSQERNSYSHQIPWTSMTCKPTPGLLPVR